MTTPLANGTVIRSIDHEIDGRQVIISLEIKDDRPVCCCRFKGLRTGHYFDLIDWADLISEYPRDKSNDTKVPVRQKHEAEKFYNKKQTPF